MTSLVIDNGNGTSAVIGTTSLDIIITPDEIYGEETTWNLTERCIEWCMENRVPINMDGTADGIMTEDF